MATSSRRLLTFLVIEDSIIEEEYRKQGNGIVVQTVNRSAVVTRRPIVFIMIMVSCKEQVASPHATVA
jgi:hypothetical protein